MEYALAAVALFLAFSNGANDNFKGFATVWGAQALSYRQALTLATLATLAGSLAAWWLAGSLVQQFSGKGLVPDAVASAPLFMLSVATAAACTVFLATRLGFPISTTHALLGGLIGAGLGQAGGQVHLDKLAQTFLLPLLLSPVLAAGLGVVLFQMLKRRNRQQDCACVVTTANPSLVARGGTHAAAQPSGQIELPTLLAMPHVVVASAAQCDTAAQGAVVQARVSVSALLNKVHVGSGATICFARALNDTPKLAALLVAARLSSPELTIPWIALLMALGGLLFAKRVAHTMSQKVTRLDDTQGLTANLISALLVLMASKFGLPVSTTHVSVGAIAGVGASAGTLDTAALRNIVLSWVAALPLALVIAWLVASGLQ